MQCACSQNPNHAPQVRHAMQVGFCERVPGSSVCLALPNMSPPWRHHQNTHTRSSPAPPHGVHTAACCVYFCATHVTTGGARGHCGGRCRKVRYYEVRLRLRSRLQLAADDWSGRILGAVLSASADCRSALMRAPAHWSTQIWASAARWSQSSVACAGDTCKALFEDRAARKAA